ncbi:MAG: NHL repeat-containing protein [Candidatus Dormibacteria bacterium]
MTTAIGTAVVALVSGTSLLNVQAAQSFKTPTWTLQIGQQGSAFVYPWGMAWDPVSGTILTTDYNNYQVQRFTTAGAPDGKYSSKVALGGDQPYGIAVDPTTDDFLVDDLGGYLRYSSTGVLLNTVDAHPDGVHYAPWIAVNPTTGTVYLVNSNSTTGPNMVLMFDKNDNYLSQFGVVGTSCAGGQFGLIRGVDTDSAGNVYIGDVSNHCVEVFSSSGTFLRYFSTKAGLPTKEQLSGNTRGLKIDRANNLVYIADAGNQNVAVFTTAGAYVGTIGTPGTDCGGSGQLDGPRDTAIGPTGTVYVSDYTCFGIDAYNPLSDPTSPGGFIESIPNPTIPPPAGGLNQAVGVAVSPLDGTVYVSDSFNQRIQEFQGLSGTTPGAFVQMWGSRQPVLNAYCAMDYPRGVTVDSNGNLWVNDTRSGYIKAYTPTGNTNGPLGCATPSTGAVSSYAEFGGQVMTGTCITCSPGKFFYARGIFVGGPSNDVYVPDSANGRLQVLTQSGTELPGFPVACGTVQHNPAAYNGCTGVTANPITGTIYAASINQGVVDVFSSTGGLIKTIGATAPGGRLVLPFDVALSPNGSILYVTSVGSNRISEFNPSNGSYLGSWGSTGSAHGQFVEPMGIVVDAAGDIYVNDFGNDRIEVFKP